MVLQGHIEKGVVVLDQPLALPDGTLVRVEPIAPAPTGFWQAPSLAELAARQGVCSPTRVDDLLGGWPSEEVEDDFDKAFLDWRQREQEAS